MARAVLMTPTERGSIDKLERNLFGEDGTGGAVGRLDAQMREVRSDLDRIRGGIAALALMGSVLTILEALRIFGPAVAWAAGQ